LIDIPEPIKRYDRFHYLVEHLSNLRYGVTVEEMAEAVRKSEKTIRRDLLAMEAILGIELIKERGDDRRYRYRIEKDRAAFRPLLLSTYEVLALYFIRGFAHFRDIPFIQKNLTEVFKKINDSTAKAQTRVGNDFFKRVSNLFILPRELGGKVYGNKTSLNFIDKIIEAALDYRVCELTYGIGEREKKYRIGPLHFFNYRDTIYILSRNMTLSERYSEDIFTNLALHRVKDVKFIENEYFEYPSNFDVERYFETDLFNFEEEKRRIKLKFLPHTREYILEREWYPNQKEELLQDGGVVISFESDLNMILIGWIRGFGSDVEVIEPPELRGIIIRDIERNLSQYIKGSGI
jgi:predicted DNA-binding transcriptional regulator YafY